MEKLYQFKLALWVVLLASFTFGFSAQAVCPVCTVAVGAGVGFSRWLGIDDVITGLWIGALLMSVSMWTINWLESKNIRFRGRKVVIIWTYYLLTVVPLYYTGIMGHAYNTLWGIDKLLLGIILGSLFFVSSEMLYEHLKKKNNNHAYFPYQKVVMPVAALAIASGIFYFLIR